jgi:DNA replication protein DnaC
MSTDGEQLRSQLLALGLRAMAAVVETEAATAAKSQMAYTAFLAKLVSEELAAKVDRSVNARRANAHLPARLTLEGFDFGFQPSINPARVRELGELGFVGRAANVLFVGPPGVGKTHLATGLAVRACLARKRVLFTQATALLDQLVAAQVTNTLGRTLQALRGQDLLVVDELGYTPMDAQRGTLFFQLVSQTYAHRSLVITTNVAFEHWGRIFGHDEVLAAAILDRLLHHAEVFAIDGPSYRLRGIRGLAAATGDERAARTGGGTDPATDR